MPTTVTDALRLPPGPVGLDTFDPRATPGAPGGKRRTRKALADQAAALSEWQERLYAEAAGGGRRRVLLVLQGMDTSGKGGVIRHAIGALNPQGASIVSFKRPTPQELSHHFLWRIRRSLPGPGMVGVFDRSHYEDVLIGKVRGLAPPEVIERRYAEIVRFEQRLVADEVTVLKCFLHISADEQRERLLARLDKPTKHWKFNPGDVEEREVWPAYRSAYETALERCSTDEAPWYVVPGDRKWYRNWAVGQLLLEALLAINPRYPTADFDVEQQRRLVAAS